MTAPDGPPAAATIARHRHRHERSRPAACPSAGSVLVGVYHPDRLTVLNRCQRVAGTVEEVRLEADGDVHFDIQVGTTYRRLLSQGNEAEQHGWLVVELMPRDGGHLPAPAVGDRVALIGAWVDDSEHAWHEVHPVWTETINGGPAHRSGPQFGGSPASDRSYDAAADCRTARGARCRGYGARGPTPAPGQRASCTVSAAYDPSYQDYDVYVHSNQPDQAVTVSDTRGDSHRWHTDSRGYADVYLRVSGDPHGQRVTARVGGAVCSTTLA